MITVIIKVLFDNEPGREHTYANIGKLHFPCAETV